MNMTLIKYIFKKLYTPSEIIDRAIITFHTIYVCSLSNNRIVIRQWNIIFMYYWQIQATVAIPVLAKHVRCLLPGAYVWTILSGAEQLVAWSCRRARTCRLKKTSESQSVALEPLSDSVFPGAYVWATVCRRRQCVAWKHASATVCHLEQDNLSKPRQLMSERHSVARRQCVAWSYVWATVCRRTQCVA